MFYSVRAGKRAMRKSNQNDRNFKPPKGFRMDMHNDLDGFD